MAGGTSGAQALRNTARGLAGAGAGFADVVRFRFFVTDGSPEKNDDFMAGIHRVADERSLPQPLTPGLRSQARRSSFLATGG